MGSGPHLRRHDEPWRRRLAARAVTSPTWRIVSIRRRANPNAGTIGGNVANGSPIGDLPPALIALGASVILRKGEERRELPLEKFFLGYKQQDRRAGEFVEALSVPKLGAASLFHVSKVSKRFDEDISAVCGAFHLLRGGDGRISEARLAYGGMAATPKRASRAETSLIGELWNEAAADRASAVLEQTSSQSTIGAPRRAIA